MADRAARGPAPRPRHGSAAARAARPPACRVGRSGANGPGGVRRRLPPLADPVEIALGSGLPPLAIGTGQGLPPPGRPTRRQPSQPGQHQQRFHLAHRHRARKQSERKPRGQPQGTAPITAALDQLAAVRAACASGQRARGRKARRGPPPSGPQDVLVDRPLSRRICSSTTTAQLAVRRRVLVRLRPIESGSPAAESCAAACAARAARAGWSPRSASSTATGPAECRPGSAASSLL